MWTRAGAYVARAATPWGARSPRLCARRVLRGPFVCCALVRVLPPAPTWAPDEVLMVKVEAAMRTSMVCTLKRVASAMHLSGRAGQAQRWQGHHVTGADDAASLPPPPKATAPTRARLTPSASPPPPPARATPPPAHPPALTCWRRTCGPGRARPPWPPGTRHRCRPTGALTEAPATPPPASAPTSQRHVRASC